MNGDDVISFDRSRWSIYFGLAATVIVPIAMIQPVWMCLRITWRIVTTPRSYQGGSVLFAIVTLGVAAGLTYMAGAIPWIAYRNWRDRHLPFVALRPEGITIYQRPPVTLAWSDIADADIRSSNRAISLCLTLRNAADVDGVTGNRTFNLALLGAHPKDLLAAILSHPAYLGQPAPCAVAAPAIMGIVADREAV